MKAVNDLGQIVGDGQIRDLTPEEAQAAYDAAVPVPISEERIQEIVVYATSEKDTPGPQTHEEARWFHEGFLAGVTAYCAAVGHSCLKSDNKKLREVFDAQGWRTIEMFEKIATSPVVCEHGVKDGDFCEPCREAVRFAEREQLEGFDCHAGFAPGTADRPTFPDEVAKPIRDEVKRIMGQHPLATTKLECANCGEVSSNPGQFLPDGRWVCTAACRKELGSNQ